jgi:hypothetical protein
VIKPKPLDLDGRYAVRGWKGIAFRIDGFPRRFEPYTALAVDEETGEEYEEETGEGEWVEQDESCGRVVVIMVGDDREHEVDVEDLTPLADGEYCGSCGSIGCPW